LLIFLIFCLFVIVVVVVLLPLCFSPSMAKPETFLQKTQNQWNYVWHESPLLVVNYCILWVTYVTPFFILFSLLNIW
jgi:hypothetical protein